VIGASDGSDDSADAAVDDVVATPPPSLDGKGEMINCYA
jgi:hypothetical protein